MFPLPATRAQAQLEYVAKVAFSSLAKVITGSTMFVTICLGANSAQKGSDGQFAAQLLHILPVEFDSKYKAVSFV